MKDFNEKIQTLIQKYPNVPIYYITEPICNAYEEYVVQEGVEVERTGYLWYDGNLFTDEEEFIEYYMAANATCSLRRGNAYDEESEDLYEDALRRWDYHAKSCILVTTRVAEQE